MMVIHNKTGLDRGHSFGELPVIKRPCWSCQSEVEDVYSCSHCEVIQEFLKESDYFTCFELDYKLNIDLDLLEERYYDLSRKFHPDYYQQKSSEEQVISLENTALLNKSYRTLKDPQKRVAYLISLVDGDNTFSTTPPADLFEEIFEVQEALEAVRESSGLDTPDHAECLETLKMASEKMKGHQQTESENLLALFSRWDALEASTESLEMTAAQKTCLTEMKQILSHTGYIHRIIQDIEAVV